MSRRKTGGGAVYQDLGNTCFSFLTPYKIDQSYDYKTVNNRISNNQRATNKNHRANNYNRTYYNKVPNMINNVILSNNNLI